MLKVVSKDGTVIAYDKTGNGPLVILIGGAFNTRTFGPNEKLPAVLASDFTVINYDRRGRGESTDTKPYAVDREIEDIDALIDAEGGVAHLYGISSGGALALEAAGKLKNKVKKVAVFEAPFVVDASRPPIPADFAEQLQTMISEDRRSDAIRYFMTKGVGLPAFFVVMMRLMPAWSHLKEVAHTVVYDAIDIKSELNGAGKQLDGKQWAAVTMPTLVISGSKSAKWAQNAMMNLASVLPNAEHRTLQGQMHIVKPEAIGPVLIEFFK